MADTTFTDGVTITAADWFNDVNRLQYTILSDPADLPTLKGTLGPTLAAEVATTSGTSVDLTTTLPSWVKRVTILIEGLSTNGTSDIQIQLGDSGGFETSGYVGVDREVPNLTAATFSAGFVIANNVAATSVWQGTVVLNLKDAANFTWCESGTLAESGGVSNSLEISAGNKSTSAAMDRIRITTVNGTDTFDAGSIAISYE